MIQTNPTNPWRTLAKKLFSTPGLHDVTAKITAIEGQIQISCPDENSYSPTQQFLTMNKEIVSFHTFAMPNQKSLRVIIKGIPREIPEEEVKEENQNLGFEPNLVKQFTKEGKKTPVFLISLQNPQKAKEIFQLQDLFYVKVKIEAYKTTGPAQCFACQRFGHSSSNCGHPPRCVKCGGDHTTRDCTKPKEEKAKCCNCGGELTANYRGCPYYNKIIQDKKEQICEKATQNNENIKTTQLLSKLTTTYADITKSDQAKNHETPTLSANKILLIIQQLLTTIQSCKDQETKDMVLKTVISIISEFTNQDG